MCILWQVGLVLGRLLVLDLRQSCIQDGSEVPSEVDCELVLARLILVPADRETECFVPVVKVLNIAMEVMSRLKLFHAHSVAAYICIGRPVGLCKIIEDGFQDW